MKVSKLVILDQCNCKFQDLDPFVRRKLADGMKVFIPEAFHMPSFKLGRWDGRMSFATAGGATYINLLDRALPIVMDNGYEVEIEDLRPSYNFSFPVVSEQMFSHKTWPVGHERAGEQVILRDYQARAIDCFLNNLQSIQSISTSAGKTLLTAGLSLLVEPYGRTLVIVPSKALVEQTEEDYKNLGLDVGVFFGDRKEWNTTHVIATWQSLGIFDQKTRRDEVEVPLDEFIKGMVCVMIDEVHKASAKTLRDLLSGPLSHIPIRWGLTGTVPKAEHDWLSILSVLGPVVGEIKASELQKKGVLANCDVDIIQLVDEHIEYADYQSEFDYLVSDQARMKWIAEYCSLLDGNTLILVDRIKTGEFLMKHIPNSVFIKGDVKLKDRKKEYDEVRTSNSKTIIATSGTASTGINVPRLNNLVLIECGKSFTKVIQSVGRLLRKASDKDYACITDFCSTMKFSSRHISKRRSYYKEAEYPYNTRKIDYRTTKVIDSIKQKVSLCRVEDSSP